MKLIKLTHANHKTVMYVPEVQVAGFYASPGHGCTHIVAPGGAILPVLESVDDVKARLEQAHMEEPTNGK
jgi:hypothetical protein